MMHTLLCLMALSAPEPDALGDNTPLITRAEPHLSAGAAALKAGDVDLAIERYRKAKADTDTERGIIEYDVGQALVLRGMQELQEAHAAAQQQQQGEEATAPTPPDMSEAIAALERAATLSRHQGIVSEARLASGIAQLAAGKIDEGIAQLRKAIIADPTNDRAKRNLQRALLMKQQQPPPPEQQGGGDGNDDKNKDGDKGGEAGGDQKNDGEQQGEQQPQPGDQAQQGDDDKNQADGGDQQKNDDTPQQDQQKPDQQKPDQQKEQGSTEPKPKPTSKDDAKRQLQGIRSREKPLSPMEMRGTEKRQAPQGKDW